ncbi:MAG: hypothetical protein ACR2H1_10065 [Limisphaerales bacterium]
MDLQQPSRVWTNGFGYDTAKRVTAFTTTMPVLLHGVLLVFVLLFVFAVAGARNKPSLQIITSSINGNEQLGSLTILNTTDSQISIWVLIEYKTNNVWPNIPLGVPLSEIGDAKHINPHDVKTISGQPILLGQTNATWRLMVLYEPPTPEMREKISDIAGDFGIDLFRKHPLQSISTSEVIYERKQN